MNDNPVALYTGQHIIDAAEIQLLGEIKAYMAMARTPKAFEVKGRRKNNRDKSVTPDDMKRFDRLVTLGLIAYSHNNGYCWLKPNAVRFLSTVAIDNAHHFKETQP